MSSAVESAMSIDEIFKKLPADETHHMRRVGVLVDLFSQKLSCCGFFSESFQEYQDYGRAAVYHDIGKYWIPEAVLTKPGRLTEEERAIMCEHPSLAKKLFMWILHGYISGVPECLVLPAMDAAIYHHEWWNGGGYPYGIKGEEIPLLARITSICDAYDAMTSDRCYRPAHCHEFACYELKRNAGIQFDPQLTPLFLEESFDPSAIAQKQFSLLQHSSP